MLKKKDVTNNDNLLYKKIEALNEHISKINREINLLNEKEKNLKRELTRMIAESERSQKNSDNSYNKYIKTLQEMDSNLSYIQDLLKNLNDEDTYRNKSSEEVNENGTEAADNNTDFFSEFWNRNPGILEKIDPILENYSKLNIEIPGFQITSANTTNDNSDNNSQ